MTRPSLGGLGPFQRRCDACRTRSLNPGEHVCGECQARIDEWCAEGDGLPVIEAVEAEYGFTERGGHRAAR